MDRDTDIQWNYYHHSSQLNTEALSIIVDNFRSSRKEIANSRGRVGLSRQW
jgi:hypothetical protein